jgi:dUTP pyrophosphatase
MEYNIKTSNDIVYPPKNNKSSLYIQQDTLVKAGENVKIKLKVSCSEKNNNSYFLKPNNNLYLKNYSRYRRVNLKIVNISNNSYQITKGDRLFQLVSSDLEPFSKGDINIHGDGKDETKLTIIPLIDNFYFNDNVYHKGDSGIDLYCQSDVTIGAKQTIMLDLGFYCCNHSGIDLYVIPRSSIYKTPIRMSDYMIPLKNTPLIMSNAIGLIDAGYRGEIMAIVDNISNKDYVIQKGCHKSFFSLHHPFIDFKNITFVNELSNTSRGNGGFGST